MACDYQTWRPDLGLTGAMDVRQRQLRPRRVSVDPPARVVGLSIALDRRSASLLDVHFTPTSASWFDAVKGFLAKLTDRTSSAVCSDLSLIYKSPSIPRRTSIPNPSSVPPTLNACAPLSKGDASVKESVR